MVLLKLIFSLLGFRKDLFPSSDFVQKLYSSSIIKGLFSSYGKVKSSTFYILTYRLQRIENQNGARRRMIFLFYLMKDILNYKLVKEKKLDKL